MAELEQLIEQCTAEEREQIFLAACYVAFADGRLWRAKPLLDRIGRELDVPAKPASRQTYLAWRHKGRHRTLELAVPESQAARQLTYHYALEVAASDGRLSGPEREIAEMLGGHLGIVERAIAEELDASAPAEESKSRRRRRSGGKGPQVAKPDDYPAMLAEVAKPDDYPAMLAGLVGKEPDALTPLLTRFTIPLMMGAAALVVAALLWAVFSDGETSQRAEHPAEVGESSETEQSADSASKPQPELRPRPDPGPPLQAEAPLELGSLERKVDGIRTLFPNGPPLAVAPFAAEEAKAHQQAWAKYLGIPMETANSIGMKLVLIPPGAFMMGSPEEEEGRRAHEGPQHWVRITRPFYMGKYEVTQQQWQAVMGNNPNSFKKPDNPVDKVSWNDCRAFFAKLNERLGLSEAGFALPTEAQWEYACRAGSTTRWFFGDDEATLSEYAWRHGKTAELSTYPVGQKKPNPWGLYDMYGNVGEWVADFYRGSVGRPSWHYGHSSPDDPTGPTSGEWRLTRGGAWGTCRSANRSLQKPKHRRNFIGFRAACPITALQEPAEKRTGQPFPK